MKKQLYISILSIYVLFSVTTLSATTIQYVSDELTIPMRSGVTTGHKILKFLNSGVALEIVEFTDDKKHALVVPVNDSSKTGWVETRLLMTNKSAREQMVSAKKKIQSIKAKQGEIKKQLTESQRHNSELENIQTQLENKIKNLQNTLASLRKNASDPIRIADENEQLKQELVSAESKVEDLTQENLILGDHNIKQWFMIGAAVSIGSLVFGIILTRIRWKKKESWGGNY
ncbi:MAG: TIGR04211 family SH3 domain-containing protein [endosymbiont of Galathealinum brachiosum]|uniref:TIGR04211 family SH3 domain-containing protein n=1 Tax=endosymbiont of Galathealinum brachiosum TaxID=2200906 RepID=A0A370DHY7_9GAMM|nr:MAG: TIGR04211 family SH3 domain-containing protein [endosymbiont of Galathealinum brachiosum]